MSEIRIDTDKVVIAAQKIDAINNQINNNFDNVIQAISALNKSWNSDASAHAMEAFNEIVSSYREARYNSVKNYINFLQSQISDGYVNTETVNQSLSDAFK